MSALKPDYDDDPERWRSWKPPEDVQEGIAPEIHGPVVDIGCGDGRLGQVLDDEVLWIGVDASPTLLADCTRRPVVQADMRALPFRDGAFAEAAHLWCLYHVDDPAVAVAEAHRVLREGGRYFACTNARTSDPELMWEGYPPSSSCVKGEAAPPFTDPPCLAYRRAAPSAQGLPSAAGVLVRATKR